MNAELRGELGVRGQSAPVVGRIEEGRAEPSGHPSEPALDPFGLDDRLDEIDRDGGAIPREPLRVAPEPVGELRDAEIGDPGEMRGSVARLSGADAFSLDDGDTLARAGEQIRAVMPVIPPPTTRTSTSRGRVEAWRAGQVVDLQSESGRCEVWEEAGSGGRDGRNACRLSYSIVVEGRTICRARQRPTAVSIIARDNPRV
ncbi:MAG: hypothetical protein ABI601_17110 [bacterium]